jgi:hypothetical protein
MYNSFVVSMMWSQVMVSGPTEQVSPGVQVRVQKIFATVFTELLSDIVT